MNDTAPANIRTTTSRDEAEKWLTPEGEATLRALEEAQASIRIKRLLEGE